MSAPSSSSVLVAYFSATGTTARVARALAAATGGSLCEIAPMVPYTDADLDWHDSRSRSSRDMHDPQSRPPVKADGLDMSAYDTLYLGYPIWWDEAPREINTFIETHQLGGKRVIPFATSGGSGIAHSVRQLQKAYPGIRWGKGRLLHATDGQTLRDWAEKEMNTK